jgi:hypothetical protein
LIDIRQIMAMVRGSVILLKNDITDFWGLRKALIRWRYMGF